MSSLAMHFYLAAGGAGTLTTFVQTAVMVLLGPLGWVLLLGLVAAGFKCWGHRHYGLFAVDVAFAIFLAVLIFNASGVESLIQNTSKGIHG